MTAAQAAFGISICAILIGITVVGLVVCLTVCLGLRLRFSRFRFSMRFRFAVVAAVTVTVTAVSIFAIIISEQCPDYDKDYDDNHNE